MKKPQSFAVVEVGKEANQCVDEKGPETDREDSSSHQNQLMMKLEELARQTDKET